MTALEPPACIGIIGAGPVGVEAALYARFLGYRVHLFEQQEVGASLRPQADQPLWAPFSQCVTSLGLQALEAQDESFLPPADTELLMVGDWLGRYLIPLAASDLVADSLLCPTQVLSVTQLTFDESAWEAVDDDHPEPDRFELLASETGSPATTSTRWRVSAVIDATGGQAHRGEASLVLQTEQGAVIEAVSMQSPVGQEHANACGLVLSVPHFYRLGAAGHAGDDSLGLTQAYAQIRDLFQRIGDRSSLNLYRS